MKQKESTKEVLDDTDIAILEHIQQDGRMSNSKLAEKVNPSETLLAPLKRGEEIIISMVTPLS